jgi:deazaflavin-dependent oxidoreductase (nitroreductase family)
VSKYRIVRFVQRYLFNPPARAVMALGLSSRHAILETTGRVSGKPRRVPIGICRDGEPPDEIVWFVSEHGRRSDYVRNLEANPGVRIRLKRTWRSGRAEAVPDDDPYARLDACKWFPGHAATVRAMGTDLLTIRIVLDPR